MITEKSQSGWYPIIIFVQVVIEDVREFVIFPIGGLKPPNRFYKHLAHNEYKYATVIECPKHKSFANICYGDASWTIRYVGSNKCIKCIDEVAEKSDKFGRVYRFRVNDNYYHKIRQLSNNNNITTKCAYSRIKSKKWQFTEWVDIFRDCE